MKNKIIFISSSAMPLEVFLLDQIKLLSKKYEIILITNYNNYNKKIFNDFNIISIPISRNINLLNDFISLIKVIFFFIKFKPKLIISITPKGGLISSTANYFIKIKHLHFITGQNWINKNGFLRFFYKSIDKFTFSNASSLLLDSSSQIKFLKSEKFKIDKMKLINSGSICGVRTDIFLPNKTFKYSERKKLEINKNTIIILYAGRIHYEKGIYELYNVCKKIFNEGFKISLFLVGAIEDKNFFKIIEQNKSFISYFEHNAFPQKFMQISDIFCIPSYREGFGLSVIEASACELPILGTNINGLKDSILDNHTGILFKPYNEIDFYNKLKKLIMNEGLRYQLGKSGRKRVLSNFNKKDVLNFIDMHIHKIINSS